MVMMPRIHQRLPSHAPVTLAAVGVAPLAEHQMAVGAVAVQQAGAPGVAALVIVCVLVAHFLSGGGLLFVFFWRCYECDLGWVVLVLF